MENNIKLRVTTAFLIICIMFSIGIIAPENSALSISKVDAATSQMTLSGITKPGTLKKGQAFVIRGTIKSTLSMKKVEVGIVQNGQWVKGNYTCKYPNSKTFNIFSADSALAFGNLKPGTYYYRIWAQDTNGSKKLLDHKFVVSKTPAASKFTLSGITKPVTQTKGKSFTIKGTVNSALAIKQINVGIATKDGKKWISNHVITKYPKLLAFNIGSVDSQLKFSNLAAGSYRYKVWAYDANGAHLIINHPFTVKAIGVPSKPTTGLSVSKLNTYAKNNWNSNKQNDCANYAYNCLKAAGYTLPNVTCKNTLGDIYTNVRIAAPAQLQYFVNKKVYKVIWNSKYQNLSDTWIKNNIKPGDLIYTTYSKYFSKKYACHVLICHGIDKKGKPLYTAHSSKHYNDTVNSYQYGDQKILAVVKMGMK